MNKIILINSAFCILLSCSTSTKSKKNGVLEFEIIEQINLGQIKKDVIRFLGDPATEKKIISENKKYQLLEYRNADEYKSQRASIVLDPITEKVLSKTFVPTETDQASSLDYLTSEKYKNLKFIYYFKPSCSAHSSSAESVALNVENGIVINYVRKDLGVLDISWMELNKVKNFAQNLEICQKSTNAPK